MELGIQALLLSVSDLEPAIDFYQRTIGLPVLRRDDKMAIVRVNAVPRRQVLVLRGAMTRNPVHLGGGSLGLRLLVFEATSSEGLDEVEHRLSEAGAFVTRRSGDGWEAVVGLDPDRNHVGVSASTTGVPITTEAWQRLDDFLYSVAP